MMLSSKTVDKLNLDFSIVDKKYQSMYGLMCRHKKVNNIVTTCPILAKSYNKQITEFHKNSGLYSQIKKQIYIVRDEQEHTSNKYYFPHIVAYAQHATEIEIEKAILDNKLSIDCIRSIFVDCIYTNKKLNLNEFFTSEKKCGSPKDTYINNYTTPIELSKKSDYYDDVLFKDRLIINGNPGTGKSYLLKQVYDAYSNPMILLPNYELFNNFDDKESKDVIQNFDILMKKTENNIINQYNIILCDEYGMLSLETMKKYIDTKKTIYLSGDLAQLKNIRGTTITPENFNSEQHVLTKNYRQNDIEFQLKIEECRISNEYIFSKKQKITLNHALRNGITILSSTHTEIDKINEYAITKLNLTKKIPCRFYKTTDDFNASQMDYILNYDNDETHYSFESGITLDRKIFHRDHKFAFAVTYHTYQGKTVHPPKKICISTNNLFDHAMLYVGVSRVTEEAQLYCLQ
jgi:hypothetical protein